MNSEQKKINSHDSSLVLSPLNQKEMADINISAVYGFYMKNS